MITKIEAPAPSIPVTLGAWVAGLRPGSPCFCCGEELCCVNLPSARLHLHGGGLRCPRCGAEVGDRGMAESDRTTAGPERRVLVAA